MEDRKYKHLTLEDRLTIERMLRKGFSKKEIAAAVGCCVRTIYYEIKRATYEHTTDLAIETRYVPERSHQKYLQKMSQNGRKPKIPNDPAFEAYVGAMIKKYKYSPKAILMQIKTDGIEFSSKVKSVNTIYAAIAKGYIDGVTLEYLPRRGRIKRKKKKVKVRSKQPAGTSIELRDEKVLERDSFGNWEMDCVIGKLKNRKTLLVLTERKTRYEIMEVLKAHNTHEVVKALNRIEKRVGCDFYKIFKTITVDNGSEFRDWRGMEKALYRVGSRTKVYYCHPHAPHERGSNENNNILIRRFLKKGEDFDRTLTRPRVKSIEEWVNFYPRAIFGGESSFLQFEKELDKIGCKFAL